MEEEEGYLPPVPQTPASAIVEGDERPLSPEDALAEKYFPGLRKKMEARRQQQAELGKGLKKTGTIFRNLCSKKNIETASTRGSDEDEDLTTREWTAVVFEAQRHSRHLCAKCDRALETCLRKIPQGRTQLCFSSQEGKEGGLWLGFNCYHEAQLEKRGPADCTLAVYEAFRRRRSLIDLEALLNHMRTEGSLVEHRELMKSNPKLFLTSSQAYQVLVDSQLRPASFSTSVWLLCYGCKAPVASALPGQGEGSAPPPPAQPPSQSVRERVVRGDLCRKVAACMTAVTEMERRAVGRTARMLCLWGGPVERSVEREDQPPPVLLTKAGKLNKYS